MMRELKFRAWNRTVRRYQYFSLQEIEKQKGTIQWHILTIEQYTGRKDINRNDIYDGDILKYHGIVKWCNESHRWTAIDLNWNDRREVHDLDYLTSPFDVIGNIHENPELIAVKEI